MRSLKHFITHPKDILLVLISRSAYLWPSKLYLRLLFRLNIGKKLNLDNPQSFNEKLQWLKLYDQRPEYTVMVDKIASKKWVSDKIGEKYIIPTLGIWDKAEDIDFDSLPNQFVLKTNHDSGGVIICKDKFKLDIRKARKTLDKSLRRNYYIRKREWPYKNVSRRILAENLIFDVDNPDKPLNDYKFFCFNGEMVFMLITNERGLNTTKFDYFDKQFNHLPFKQGGENYQGLINRPKNFDLMISLAEKLSMGIPHVRVDFYDVNGKVYFGEMTFFDSGGFATFDPEEWDYKFGSLLRLPEAKYYEES